LNEKILAEVRETWVIFNGIRPEATAGRWFTWRTECHLYKILRSDMPEERDETQELGFPCFCREASCKGSSVLGNRGRVWGGSASLEGCFGRACQTVLFRILRFPEVFRVSGSLVEVKWLSSLGGTERTSVSLPPKAGAR
jgi:hypothetical protein